MPYFIAQDGPEMYDFGIDPLDGDIDKVGPLDMTPDDGNCIQQTCTNQGRSLDFTHMPTKWRIGGRKRNLVDVQPAWGAKFVDEKFKNCVEELEPDVHEFFPIELVYKDGTHAGFRYWFNPCTRLDAIDPIKTTYEKRSLYGVFDGNYDRELWFSKAKIGNHHIWIEKLLVKSPVPMHISDELKSCFEEVGVTGLNYTYTPMS